VLSFSRPPQALYLLHVADGNTAAPALHASIAGGAEGANLARLESAGPVAVHALAAVFDAAVQIRTLGAPLHYSDTPCHTIRANVSCFLPNSGGAGPQPVFHLQQTVCKQAAKVLARSIAGVLQALSVWTLRWTCCSARTTADW
jgi:hypothetical protein